MIEMAMPDVKDKVAVITGASRGIGLGLAERFAELGMKLGLCSRSAPGLESGDSVHGEQLDVRDEAALVAFAEKVVERFGAIDLWVNNAGVLEPIQPVRDTPVADFELNVDVNLVGAFVGTKVFANHVRGRNGEGVLINVSSGAAWKAYEGWGAYCASKAGLARLTEVVAAEEAGSGLRAYSVAPGVVDTAMQAMIRDTPAERFPELERFLELKEQAVFNSPRWVADQFLAIAFDPERRDDGIDQRIPSEHEAA